MERTLISFSIFVHLLWLHKHVPRKKTGKQGRDGSYSKEKINLFTSSSMRRKQEKRFKYWQVLYWFISFDQNGRPGLQILPEHFICNMMMLQVGFSSELQHLNWDDQMLCVQAALTVSGNLVSLGKDSTGQPFALVLAEALFCWADLLSLKWEYSSLMCL